MCDTFVALDLEMTGLKVRTDRILEIGGLKVENGTVTDMFQTFVNPHRKLDEKIVKLTGINQDMISDAPEAEEALAEFLDFAGDLPLLGHNLIFDYSFLKKAAVNNNLVFPSAGIDTLKMARRILPELEHKKLDYLCEYLKIDPGNSHRALDDALSASGIYWKMYTIKPDDSGFEIPSELVYSVKKDSPITQAQRNYLTALVVKHNVKLDIPIDEMTKSIASRNIDKILSEYGK